MTALYVALPSPQSSFTYVVSFDPQNISEMTVILISPGLLANKMKLEEV